MLPWHRKLNTRYSDLRCGGTELYTSCTDHAVGADVETSCSDSGAVGVDVRIDCVHAVAQEVDIRFHDDALEPQVNTHTHCNDPIVERIVQHMLYPGCTDPLGWGSKPQRETLLSLNILFKRFLS